MKIRIVQDIVFLRLFMEVKSSQNSVYVCEGGGGGGIGVWKFRCY